MGYNLAQFADTVHRFLKQDLGDDVPERKILYEDPELGFCILAHSYNGAKESQPHDHGPSWAIYGQARGETMMSDWTVLEPATKDKAGKVRRAREYPLKPGMAKVYNVGDVHSPRREGATRLIRIEGTNMDKVKRWSFRISPSPCPLPLRGRGCREPLPAGGGGTCASLSPLGRG